MIDGSRQCFGLESRRNPDSKLIFFQNGLSPTSLRNITTCGVGGPGHTCRMPGSKWKLNLKKTSDKMKKVSIFCAKPLANIWMKNIWHNFLNMQSLETNKKIAKFNCWANDHSNWMHSMPTYKLTHVMRVLRAMQKNLERNKPWVSKSHHIRDKFVFFYGEHSSAHLTPMRWNALVFKLVLISSFWSKMY